MTAGEWDEAIEAVASQWSWKDHAFLCPVYNERRMSDARGCNCGIREKAKRLVDLAAPLIARAALEKAADAVDDEAATFVDMGRLAAAATARHIAVMLRERAKEAGGG